MKRLLAAILILFSVSAIAETKWYLDLERQGEGIIVTEYDDPNDPRIIFAFYSHTAQAGVPPVVSPAPPEPLFCDKYTVWFSGISERGLENGIAYGKVYYQVALDTFPEPRDRMVSDTYIVGDFVLQREDGGYGGGAGWNLVMKSNYLMCNLTVFGQVYHFTKRIAE